MIVINNTGMVGASSSANLSSFCTVATSVAPGATRTSALAPCKNTVHVGGWVSSCAVSPFVVFPPCGVWLGLCVGRVDPAR